MLTGLTIQNVVLIEALELDLRAGFTALTGETGAGKSIILDALSMATGARSDKGLIRSGAKKAQCTAEFTLNPSHNVWRDLDEAGVDQDESLVLRRVINSDGRSRAYINDTPVSVKLLSKIGADLLEVHGQHDGRGLLDASQHIRYLDLIGGYKEQLVACKKAFLDMREKESHLGELSERHEKAASDKDFLVHAIAELDRLDARLGEEAELVSQRRFLQGAENALEELSQASIALGEEGVFEQRLATALSGIERVKSKLGDTNSQALDSLDLAAKALEKAILETQEAREAVSHAAGRFVVEPGQLDQAEKRLFALRGAARKFNVDIEMLAAQRDKFSQELSSIETIDEDLKRAQVELEKTKKFYQAKADILTQLRIEAGIRLDKKVASELPPLKMENARFQTVIEESAPSETGQDKVSFRVTTNPGTALGPLQKIASGGELARISLAIKVALASKTEAVMVFDEVDQGVGGAVADAVGRRLAKLSEKGQVFVVTHSPQVAACADHQFKIKKSSAGAVTTTHVIEVDAEDREEEIARMLAGETIPQEARAAARQLMKAS